MGNNTTKILIAIVLILILGLSFLGLYKYFSRAPAQTESGQRGKMSAFPQSPDVAGQETPLPPQKRFSEAQPTEVSLFVGSNIKIITNKPISGSYFSEQQKAGNRESKLYIRYTERESGHLYEIAYNENIPKKLSNTTITRVYESYYNNLGDNFLYRRLDEDNRIQNIYAKLETPPASTSTENILTSDVGRLNQSLLQFAIQEVTISPSRDKIFYLTAIGDSFIGTIENFGGKATGKKQVFSSPLSEWLIQWPKDNTLFFNTKPSANVPGYLYSTNIDKKDFTKILGDINGLASNISPNLKKLVYSESANGWVTTSLYDLIKKGRSTLPLKTLPEKCIWGGVDKDLLYCAIPFSPNNNKYPDSWYQGIESFNDEIWLINTATGQTNIITDKDTLAKNGGMIDAINLQLSPKEDYLSLINKKDLSLWLIKIK